MNDFQFQDMIIYHYILSDRLLLDQTKPEYFANSILKGMFSIAKEYGLQYNSAPSKEELKNIIQLKMLSDEYTDDIVDTIYDSCNMDEYSDEWLRKNSADWIRVRNMDYIIRKAVAYMKTSNLSSSNAEVIIENVRSMFINETAIDFDFNQGCDFFDASAHAHSELEKYSTGYKYMDIVLKGGYYKGGLFVLLAGPKCGKSFWLCNLAAESIKMGNNTLYITLELPEFMVNKRIAANLLGITQDEYSVKCKDLDYIRTRLNEIKYANMMPMGDLHVKQFPTSTLSVQSLEIFIKKLEELKGIKYKNVVIDYINIMQNAKNPNSENTYLKIKTIAEDLRAIGQANDWTMITVTQTNRDGWETTDLSVKDIAESAGLLHTVDGLFGVITNPEMKSNGEYYLKAMAIRDGSKENTKKKFFINWDYGRITEDLTSDIEDCSVATNFTNRQNGRNYNNNQPQQSQSVQPFTPPTSSINMLPLKKEIVYKNNTRFKNTSKVKTIFKCEMELGGNETFKSGDIIVFKQDDSVKSCVCIFRGLSIDFKNTFEIYRFGCSNIDSTIKTPECLGDIFDDDNEASVYKVNENKTMVKIGKCSHPMDVNVIPMTEEITPMGTDVITNRKVELTTDGLNLGTIEPKGLFSKNM